VTRTAAADLYAGSCETAIRSMAPIRVGGKLSAFPVGEACGSQPTNLGWAGKWRRTAPGDRLNDNAEAALLPSQSLLRVRRAARPPGINCSSPKKKAFHRFSGACTEFDANQVEGATKSAPGLYMYREKFKIPPASRPFGGR